MATITETSSETRRYLQVLRKALFIEALGETAYRMVERKETDPDLRRAWRTFSDEEHRMRGLLCEEYRAVRGKRAPGWILPAGRAIGSIAALVRTRFTRRWIERVLDKRRYTSWGHRWSGRNRLLWRELVEHERAQVQYFQDKSS
jgi:hypothetical protein